MRDYMARALYWILAILNWLRDNRPEWCWGQPIGYKETFDDPVVYKVLFSGFRLRGLSKRTFGVTKQVAMTDKEKDDYYFSLGVTDGESSFVDEDDDGEETTLRHFEAPVKDQIEQNAEPKVIEASAASTDEIDVITDDDVVEDEPKKSD